MKTILLTGFALLGVAGSVAATRGNDSRAAAPCQVQGVWQLERLMVGGKEQPVNYQQRKIMTKNHFMWVNQEARRDTLPLKTLRDTARVMNDAGGYGSYTVSGTNLTEHIELFPTPSWIGRDWKATCETDRTHWVHHWISDEYKDSTNVTRRDTVDEHYIRVE
jgi:hypothetical protein